MAYFCQNRNTQRPLQAKCIPRKNESISIIRRLSQSLDRFFRRLSKNPLATGIRSLDMRGAHATVMRFTLDVIGHRLDMTSRHAATAGHHANCRRVHSRRRRSSAGYDKSAPGCGPVRTRYEM